MLDAFFLDNRDYPAIWIDTKCMTYESFFLEIEDLALKLTQKGINSSHRIAFIAEMNFTSIVTFFALLKIGASPCLLSTRIPLEQVESYLDLARISFFLDHKMSVVRRGVVNTNISENAILLFTSGSSGFPKLVSLKVSHFLQSADGSISRLGLSHQSCYFLTVPLFHVSGLSILFRALKAGCSVALSANCLDGYARASHISMVPTQLLRALEKKCFFPNLKCILLGGAQISENLVQLALERKIPLYLTYGMTEMASQITMTCLNEPLNPVHLGKPLKGKEITFSSEGEILVRGSSLFTGYDSLSGVERTLCKDGWFATGDLGAWNENYNLEYKGRKDNLFVSGGENIYPESIERALGRIPGILQSLVVPLEDREFGHRPVAFIDVEGPMPIKEELYNFLSRFLPKFCLPIHFLPFPVEVKSQSFKIKRKELQKWLQTHFVK